MNFKLETKIRKTGKQSMLTEIRTSSRVPGVVYGFKKDPVNIDMDYNTLLKVLKEAGTSNVIDIQVDGKSIPAIVREYQQDPVTDKLTHIDFMAVDAKRTLTTVVPLEFVGTSKVVREQGGKLEIKNQQVNVQCLPDDLPATIEVDVSLLKEMGQILSIKDLVVSDKVIISNDPNDPVVSVAVPKKMKIEETVEEGETPEGEEGAEGETPAEGAAPAEGEAKAEEKSEDKK